MPTSAAALTPFIRALLDPEGARQRTLEEYLAGIPRLTSLSDVPAGTAVLVRGDVDCKPGAKIGDGDVRLRSMVPTLKYGRDRGWKQVVFGHIGRKPEGSLKAVAARLGELLGCDVPLVTDWLDEASLTIPDAVAKAVAGSPPGAVLVLENTRRYAIERVLWEATASDAAKLAETLAKLANQFADKIARVYVNEALSAGSLDTSTTIVPAAMERVALGKYVADEFDGPMRRCLRAELVVFSGLKSDKLDDLEAMIQRGHARYIFAGGSLAMALKKADAQLAGRDFCLGVAEDPAHRDKPYYIEPERIEQAKRMLSAGRAKGMSFVLPVDFVLQDGRTADVIGPQDQQFDVGPKTSDLFERRVGDFLAASKGWTEKVSGTVSGHTASTPPDIKPETVPDTFSASSPTPAVAFHNGVLGMFEDSRFEQGTRRFIAQLKRMKDAGVEVYVGGGEGGAALEKYGQPDWVTHCFTAGGTVLNALGSKPVPYLQALSMAVERGS